MKTIHFTTTLAMLDGINYITQENCENKIYINYQHSEQIIGNIVAVWKIKYKKLHE